MPIFSAKTSSLRYPPKSSILKKSRFPYINHPFWGIPPNFLGNTLQDGSQQNLQKKMEGLEGGSNDFPFNIERCVFPF